MSFKINQVCERLGISAATLRNWEQRYTLLNPPRTQGGQRLYSQAHLDLLREVKRRLTLGERISDIADDLKSPRARHETPVIGETALLLSHLANFDLAAAQETYTTLLSVVPRSRLVDQVLHPILKSVGDGWRDHRYSITQEHFITNFIRMKAYALLSEPEVSTPNSRKVVFAALEGESHEGGLLLTALVCKQRGYTVIYLGASMPVPDLLEIQKTMAPTALCLSFPYRLPSGQELRQLSRSSVPVIIGGSAVQNLAPHLFPRNINLVKAGDWAALFKLIDHV